MDGEDVNPLNLTLDELIKLNKMRNEQQQVEDAPLQLNITTRKNSLTNGNGTDTTGTFKIPSSTTPIKTGSVHERLGWNTLRHRPYLGKTMKQNYASRAVKNAQHLKIRPTGKSFRTMNNTRVVPQLTRSILQRHNNATGNFFINRSCGASSVHSAFSARSTTFSRHSAKKSLTPEIQQILCNLQNEDQPCMLMGSGEFTLKVDNSRVKLYRHKPCTTSLSTQVRFAINE